MLVRKLGLKVALTVKSSRFDETFGLVVFDFEQNAISGHLLVIVDLENISDSDLSEACSFELNLLTTLLVSSAAGQGHANDWCGIDLLVRLVASEFANQLLDHTEEHDQGGRDENGKRTVDSNLTEQVQNTSYEVEDVDHLLELESASDWAEA